MQTHYILSQFLFLVGSSVYFSYRFGSKNYICIDTILFSFWVSCKYTVMFTGLFCQITFECTDLVLYIFICEYFFFWINHLWLPLVEWSLSQKTVTICSLAQHSYRISLQFEKKKSNACSTKKSRRLGYFNARRHVSSSKASFVPSWPSTYIWRLLCGYAWPFPQQTVELLESSSAF